MRFHYDSEFNKASKSKCQSPSSIQSEISPEPAPYGRLCGPAWGQLNSVVHIIWEGWAFATRQPHRSNADIKWWSGKVSAVQSGQIWWRRLCFRIDWMAVVVVIVIIVRFNEHFGQYHAMPWFCRWTDRRRFDENLERGIVQSCIGDPSLPLNASVSARCSQSCFESSHPARRVLFDFFFHISTTANCDVYLTSLSCVWKIDDSFWICFAYQSVPWHGYGW